MTTQWGIQEELQSIQPANRSGGWNAILPPDAHIRATFFKFPPPASPTSSEEEGVKGPRGQVHLPMPPQVNVSAAAVYMNAFLREHLQDGEYAIAGGFAVNLRTGSGRSTEDIDICIRGNLTTLQRAMIQKERFVLPSSRMASNAFRMYLRTGPSYGDAGCQEDHIIKVEFLIGGLGTPNFHEHIEDVSVVTAGQSHTIRTLDIFCLMKSKLSAYDQRGAMKDYHDILSLVKSHSELVRGFKYRLDPDKASKVIEEMSSQRQPQGNIDFVKRILLVDATSSSEDEMSREKSQVPDARKTARDK